MDYPIRESAVHHFRKLRQTHFVAVQFHVDGRAVKGEIQNAVVALAQKVQIVFEFLARVAGQMAEFRVPAAGDDFEHRDDVQAVFRAVVPH